MIRHTVLYGEKLTFSALSMDTHWTDITIVLSDGFNTVTWMPLTADLDNGPSTTVRYPALMLGDTTVFCNITDIAGNGRIDQGDFFTLTAGSASGFNPAMTHTVTIIYDPNRGEVCKSVF